MMRRLRGGGFHFSFIAHTRRWLVVSAVLMAVSIGSLAIRQFNLGLDFKGGTAMEVEAHNNATVGQIKDALRAIDVADPVVQKLGGRGFRVQTAHLGPELQQHAAEQVAKVTGVTAEDVNVTDVGPKWGKQISSKAIRALIVFLVIVAIYISIRFEPKMAGAAMVALFHDLIATAGIYSLTGLVVTPSTLIAILTILGYSLYDTVIIFDRVKERTAGLSAAGRLTYSDVANASLNQVLVRSLNTSLVSLLTVGSLLFVGSLLLGAETLEELALALFIGIAVGTYSSIFVATPILALWKEREPRWATLRARIAARSGEAGGPRVPARGAPAVEEVEAPAGPEPRKPSAVRPGTRPPQRRKKKKRRR
jgi:preprotein translocase subunit SecF